MLFCGLLIIDIIYYNKISKNGDRVFYGFYGEKSGRKIFSGELLFILVSVRVLKFFV